MDNIDDQGNYKLQRISKCEKSEIRKFLLNHYYPYDQVLQSAGIESPSESDINYFLNIIDDGLSFKMVQENEEICGIILSGEVDKNEEENLTYKINSCQCENFKKILEFYLSWERDTHLWEVVPYDKAFCIHLIAVKTSCRRKGIMKALVNRSVECAEQCKYKLVIVDCSSFYTAKYFQMMGWNCIFSLPFVHFKDNNGNPIFVKKIHPHLHVTTFALFI